LYIPDRLQPSRLASGLKRFAQRLVDGRLVGLQRSGEDIVAVAAGVSTFTQPLESSRELRRHRDRMGVGRLGRVRCAADPVVVGTDQSGVKVDCFPFQAERLAREPEAGVSAAEPEGFLEHRGRVRKKALDIVGAVEVLTA
jgi:hypothetical protein